jgi:hypothetical protein
LTRNNVRQAVRGLHPQLDSIVGSLTQGVAQAKRVGDPELIQSSTDALDGALVCRGIASMLRLLTSDSAVDMFISSADMLPELTELQRRAISALIEPR